MTSFGMRMLRAAALHADTFEEVEADRSSIGQATTVVLAACAAIGVARYVQGQGSGVAAGALAIQVTLSVVEPLVLWVGGSAFAFMVGATFFRGPATETDFPEVLRTTGFAFTPALLRIFALLPPPALGLGIDLFARAWVFVAFVVAVRQALDFTTGRAVGTFGFAALLLWLMLWGLSVAPLPV
ncbi:MAG: YIP1 family protein [Myxococcota bacterium]